MLVVDVDLIAVKDCCVTSASANLAVLRRDISVMLGVMWTSRAGARTLVASSPIYLASSVAPLGRRKTLFDCGPVFANGLVGVLMLDVAPLSTMADGIDPSSMPVLSSSSSWRYVHCALSLLIVASDSVDHRYVVSSLMRRAVQFSCACACFLVFVSIAVQFVRVLVVRGKVECDAALSLFGGDVTVVGCLHFNLARRRGEDERMA